MRAGELCQEQYGSHTVTYAYNSHGYRCAEFSQIQGPHILALGCSHTEGMSLDRPWPCVLSEILDMPVVNIGINGADAALVRFNADLWTRSHDNVRAVIAQWPDSGRILLWSDAQAIVNVPGHRTPGYQAILRESPTNLDQHWLDNIQLTNVLCNSRGVPVINMNLSNHLEPVIQKVLDQCGIHVHLDSLTDHHIWLMDNAAPDGCHHSERCHHQWATRLASLLESQ